MHKVFVKAREGVSVINHDTRKLISATGETVERSKYIERRIACGDLVVTEAPAASEPVAPPKPAPVSTTAAGKDA